MRVSIALSGGGSRCIAQLGVLAFLEEMGIHIAALSGSSGGAIVGALYAMGMKPPEILEFLRDIDYKRLLTINIHQGSLYRFDKAAAFLRERFANPTIESLPLPFVCTMVDFDSGALCYKKEGDLIDHILASCALTPIFAPYTIAGHTYIDGGFSDNLPTLPLLDFGHKVIAINVNPLYRRTKKGFFSNLSRALFIMFNTNVTEGKKHADIVVECAQMGRYSIFDTKNFDRFYRIGYDTAKEMERKIAALGE